MVGHRGHRHAGLGEVPGVGQDAVPGEHRPRRPRVPVLLPEPQVPLQARARPAAAVGGGQRLGRRRRSRPTSRRSGCSRAPRGAGTVPPAAPGRPTPRRGPSGRGAPGVDDRRHRRLRPLAHRPGARGHRGPPAAVDWWDDRRRPAGRLAVPGLAERVRAGLGVIAATTGPTTCCRAGALVVRRHGVAAADDLTSALGPTSAPTRLGARHRRRPRGQDGAPTGGWCSARTAATTAGSSSSARGSTVETDRRRRRARLRRRRSALPVAQLAGAVLGATPRALPGQRPAPGARRRRADGPRPSRLGCPTAALSMSRWPTSRPLGRENRGARGSRRARRAALLPLPDGVRDQSSTPPAPPCPCSRTRPVAVPWPPPAVTRRSVRRARAAGFRLLSVRADDGLVAVWAPDFGDWWTDLTAAALVGTARRPAPPLPVGCWARVAMARRGGGAARRCALASAPAARRVRAREPPARRALPRTTPDRRPPGCAAARVVPRTSRPSGPPDDRVLVRVWLDAAEAHGYRRRITCCPSCSTSRPRASRCARGAAPWRTRVGLAGRAEPGVALGRRAVPRPSRSRRCRGLGRSRHRRASLAVTQLPRHRPGPRAGWSSPRGTPIGRRPTRSPPRSGPPRPRRRAAPRAGPRRPVDRCARSRPSLLDAAAELGPGGPDGRAAAPAAPDQGRAPQGAEVDLPVDPDRQASATG